MYYRRLRPIRCKGCLAVSWAKFTGDRKISTEKTRKREANGVLYPKKLMTQSLKQESGIEPAL